MRISASFYTAVWCISCSAAQFLFRLICRNLTIGGKLSSSAIHLAAHSLDPGLWLTFGSPAISQARQRSSWSAFAVCHLMIRAAASPTSSGSVGCGAIPVIMTEDLAPKAYFVGGGGVSNAPDRDILEIREAACLPTLAVANCCPARTGQILTLEIISRSATAAGSSPGMAARRASST